MAYSFSGRVRYSEIGENGLLTLPGILNYFQDCSTFQSEEVGLGIDILKEWKRIWVLSAWQVVVDRYPYMGERIKTSTWAYGFRGFMGLRNFTMETEGGERLAYANTFWTYIDAENGLPVRLEAKDTDAYRGKDGRWNRNWIWNMHRVKLYFRKIMSSRILCCAETSSGYEPSCK